MIQDDEEIESSFRNSTCFGNCLERVNYDKVLLNLQVDHECTTKELFTTADGHALTHVDLDFTRAGLRSLFG